MVIGLNKIKFALLDGTPYGKAIQKDIKLNPFYSVLEALFEDLIPRVQGMDENVIIKDIWKDGINRVYKDSNSRTRCGALYEFAHIGVGAEFQSWLTFLDASTSNVTCSSSTSYPVQHRYSPAQDLINKLCFLGNEGITPDDSYYNAYVEVDLVIKAHLDSWGQDG